MTQNIATRAVSRTGRAKQYRQITVPPGWLEAIGANSQVMLILDKIKGEIHIFPADPNKMLGATYIKAASRIRSGETPGAKP